MSRTQYLAGAAAAMWMAGMSLCHAQTKPVEEQIVDDFNKLFGVHAGFRANHAKGFVAEGHFKATADAANLSKAVIFNGNTFPVTVRFSNSTGLPDIPDGAPNAAPHGIAIKYHLPDGSDTDMVLNSFKFFPVANGDEFRDFLDAVVASPPNAPKPTKLEDFIKAHPSVPAALATVATPDSFADEQYNGVDAFVLVTKDGKKQAVRYIVEPEKLVHLSKEDAAKEPPNFLIDDMTQRLAKGPVTFHLKAQLAQPGDQTKDPTKPWPADRPVVDLGVLTIDKAAANSLEAQKALFFLPGQLVDGIEKSDDPLIDTR
ncbi:MAG TPA: catalase family peroxidase, partial [Methylovirgula sp.]